MLTPQSLHTTSSPITPSPLAMGDDEWSNIVVIVPIWSEHEARGETDQDFTACRQWLILTPLSSVSISIPNVSCFLHSELRQCNIILVGSRSITGPICGGRHPVACVLFFWAAISGYIGSRIGHPCHTSPVCGDCNTPFCGTVHKCHQ